MMGKNDTIEWHVKEIIRIALEQKLDITINIQNNTRIEELQNNTRKYMYNNWMKQIREEAK